MNNKIEKPIILKLKELEEGIIKLINSSEIPAFILKPMFEKLLNQLQIIEQEELESETKKYNEQLQKKESDK